MNDTVSATAAACAGASVFNVDAGFNVGSLTRGWFDRLGSSLCVLGFEPNPTLATVRGLQAYARHYHLERAAVSQQDGEATLWYGKPNWENCVKAADLQQRGKSGPCGRAQRSMKTDAATLRTDLPVYEGQQHTGTSYKVRVVRLERLLLQLRHALPPSVQFGQLKTDLQGNDIAALRGAGWALDLFRCISMEVWGTLIVGRTHYVDPVPLLAERGFVVVRKQRRGGRREWVNFTRGNFGQLSGVNFINRRFLADFLSEDDRVAWPAFCSGDGRMDAATVRVSAAAAADA